MKSLDTFSERLPQLRFQKAELQVKINTRKAECAVIRQRMQKGATDPGNDHINRVNQLLGRPEMPVVDPDNVKLQALLVELSALQTASSAVDAAIQTEERMASNKLLDAERQEILKRGGNFAKAFIALRAAHLEFDRYVDELDSAGANVESIRLHVNGLSDPRDTSGSYPWGMRAFADAGFISKSQAPQAI